MWYYHTIESNQRNTILFLFKDTSSLKEISEQLPQSLFQWIHKSFIVAIQHIEVLEGHQLKIQDKVLPIGKTYRAALFERLGA